MGNRTEAGQAGLTLIETMVVVAIVGVIATSAVMAMKSNAVATPRSSAEQLVAMIEMARERALANRTYQRIVFAADEITHEETNTTGLVLPVTPAWSAVDHITLPRGVSVYAVDSTAAHMTEGLLMPAEGDGLDGEWLFSPDGTGTAFTAFFTDEAQTQKARVMLFSATSAALASDGW